MKLNKDQKIALEYIKQWASGSGEALISLTGVAGVGKTFLINEAKKYINNVAYTSMTGRAALRLSEAADVKASTLHSVLYQPPEILKGGEIWFNKLAVPSFNYLIVDESSMVGPKIFTDLQKWNYYHKTRILFIGDPFQLPPVLTENEVKKYGKEFSIFSYIKGPILTKIMRNDDDIVSVATMIREKHKIPSQANKAYNLIQTHDCINYAINQYFNDYNDHMIITWRNKMRMDANYRIRKKLGYNHYLPDKGEPITFKRNGQGVLNGQIGNVQTIVPGPTIEGVITYRVLLNDKKYILCSVNGKDEQMDGGMPYVKNWKNYLKTLRTKNIEEPIPITYGYVNTCHTAQGNEYRRVSVILENKDLENIYFTQETTLPDGQKVPFGIRWLYTAISRSKNKCELIIGK